MFTKSNYDNLSLRMIALLGVHDVWEVVEKGHIEPENVESLSSSKGEFERLKRDKKALSNLSRIRRRFPESSQPKKHGRSLKSLTREQIK
ncbi:hypothetical protein LR48_Vigan03g139900 [Vigna angularis]|uniref:DUF4219 domain-containing protein n=1 Tax=Phaseolus angularis TaxID=3914 RepID=A0A0L9U5U0_PHAAN|nr:hypothetical protein LR48_Vigan03g139900 [Vigna angularis]